MKSSLKLEVPKTPCGIRKSHGKIKIPGLQTIPSVKIELDKNKVTTDDIHKMVYFDGDGELRIGADDIPFNIHLLQKGVIRFFIADWKGYSDFDFFKDILSHIMETDIRDQREWKSQIVLYPSIYGILVTTKKTWILHDICKLIKSSQNDFEVCDHREEVLVELITPNEIMSYMKKYDQSIEGDKFIIYVQYGNNNSIPVKRVNCAKYAQLYYLILDKHKPTGYNICIFDVSKNKSIKGFIQKREYDTEILDPDLDLEEYFKNLEKENDSLYGNDKRILKLIRSLC